MSTRDRIRLLVVDDAPQVRQGLRSLLPLAGEAAGLQLEIVGEATTADEALRQVVALSPDVVLVDLEMRHLGGYAAADIVRARCPSARIVALTARADPSTHQWAGEAGAIEVVEKGAPTSELMRAIRGDRAANAGGEVPINRRLRVDGGCAGDGAPEVQGGTRP